MSYEIMSIPRDDESIRSYIERYKSFRLLSLQVSPASFGSTYGREIEFNDEMWYGRLANPDATTFIAVQSNRICSTLTILGPLPFPPDQHPPSANPWSSLEEHKRPELDQSHWRINGMFTLPECRGKGLAKGLIEKALKYGLEQATKSEKPFVASIVVDADNTAARALYEKCGFVPIKEEQTQDRAVLLLQYELS